MIRLNKISINIECGLAIANAILFLALSNVIMIFKPLNSTIILTPNLIYFILSVYIWFRMINKGWILTPLGWYIIGSGIFFGIGVISGGMHVYTWAPSIITESNQHILKINLINSFSILIITTVASLIINNIDKLKNELKSTICLETSKNTHNLIIIVCFLIIISKIFYFPESDNEILNSFLAKAYFILPSIFIILGILHNKLNKITLLMVYLALIIQTILGSLLLSKFEIIIPFMAFVCGVIYTSRNLKSFVILIVVSVFLFIIFNPIVALGRLHHEYSAQNNNFIERVIIVKNVIQKTIVGEKKYLNPIGTINNPNIYERNTFKERIHSIARRFDVASVQGYLINKYDTGSPGNSLVDFWAVLVPRVIWHEKPIITRYGNILSVEYHDNNYEHFHSAMAPTYTGEAYWNYGWNGVLLISIYLGICFGILSKISLQINNKNIGYLFISFQAIISAVFIESWITPTYIGGMALIFIIYYSINICFSISNHIISNNKYKIIQKKST